MGYTVRLSQHELDVELGNCVIQTVANRKDARELLRDGGSLLHIIASRNTIVILEEEKPLRRLSAISALGVIYPETELVVNFVRATPDMELFRFGLILYLNSQGEILVEIE